jgi:hypothetical protein
MRHTIFALAIGLLALGCQEATQPRVAKIEGTVRYPDGSVVYKAKVDVDGGGSTFTDRSGHYELATKGVGTTATLFAQDGFDGGAYAMIHFGRVQVTVTKSMVTQDIVLDQATPI